MREKSSTPASQQTGTKAALGVEEHAEEVPYHSRRFFESHYASTVKGDPTDRDTIGSISEAGARFHYNATQNSILRALGALEMVPEGPMAGAWRALRQRNGVRLLDVGSGTGHWIDFMVDIYAVTEAVAFEIAPSMSAFLQKKYEGRPVTVRDDDISDEGVALGGPYAYITAIGVMFHIVDDERWQQALCNLGAALADDGLLIIGGWFGPRTKNVQFHKVDDFTSWREHASAEASGRVLVNKRLRSLGAWHAAATRAGLHIRDLVRTDHDANLLTPENDILILSRNPQ